METVPHMYVSQCHYTRDAYIITQETTKTATINTVAIALFQVNWFPRFLPPIVLEENVWDTWHRFFEDQMPFLSPNQQRQSTEGNRQYETQLNQARDSKHLWDQEAEAIQDNNDLSVDSGTDTLNSSFTDDRWPTTTLLNVERSMTFSTDM